MSATLVGPAEIGVMLGGLSRQRVYQLTSKEDFPEPVAVLSNGKVWDHAEVKAWAKRHGRAAQPIPDTPS